MCLAHAWFVLCVLYTRLGKTSLTTMIPPQDVQCPCIRSAAERARSQARTSLTRWNRRSSKSGFGDMAPGAPQGRFVARFEFLMLLQEQTETSRNETEEAVHRNRIAEEEEEEEANTGPEIRHQGCYTEGLLHINSGYIAAQHIAETKDGDKYDSIVIYL